MNTLTGIEAERVNQILCHGIDRLNVLSSLPASWDDDLLDAIDHDIVHTSIQKLWTFEKNLSAFEDEMHSGGDFEIVKRTHKAIRNVCRSIQSDKDILFQILTADKKSKGIEGFIKCLNDLRNIVLSRMTTTVEDEAAHRAMLHELTERERQYEESRDALQKKLNEVIEEKEKVTASLDQTLRKLQSEIHDITQFNAVDFDNIQREMDDAIKKATSDHESRMKQLKEQIDAMEKRYADIMDKNKDEEVRLRREKTRVESALKAKLSEYDVDMVARKKALDEITASFEKEKDEYRILKEHFDQVDEDISRSNEEEDILSAVLNRQSFGEWVLNHAAATIQKIVRGRHARAIVTKLKAKRNKKRGKKGGKSKKK